MPEKDRWIKSSRCNSGFCVEVQITPSFVHVRNSEGGPVASFGHEEWTAFVAGCATGDFDIPEETT